MPLLCPSFAFLENMARPVATFRALPTEIIIRIFTLSSNPSLALICRELNYILAPLSKSIAIRIDFLLVRYRNNYVKAVVKGLRWAFFDLELLKALDRLYLKEMAARQPCSTKLSWDSQFGSKGDHSSSSLGYHQETSSIVDASRRSDPQEPPRKKRKKYGNPMPGLDSRHSTPMDQDPSNKALLQVDASRTCQEDGIPLPKDFAMPRRLFKSSDHLPLINILLARGASPSHPSHYPLVRASQRGDVEMVKTLFAFGAPPEMKALQLACVEERDEVLDLFLERGVRPDNQCLSLCVEKGKTRMIDRLLELGVVPDLKTVLGF